MVETINDKIEYHLSAEMITKADGVVYLIFTCKSILYSSPEVYESLWDMMNYFPDLELNDKLDSPSLQVTCFMRKKEIPADHYVQHGFDTQLLINNQIDDIKNILEKASRFKILKSGKMSLLQVKNEIII